MSSLFQEFKQAQSEWKEICKTKDHQQIIAFFDKHHTNASWAKSIFYDLVINDNIESMKYVLQKCDIPSINHFDLRWFCSFEMLQLLFLKGIQYPEKIGKIICELVQNKKMMVDDIYLCIDHLITNTKRDISDQNILYALTYQCPLKDPIKMAKFIENKIDFIKKQCDQGTVIREAFWRKNWTFFQFLIDNYDAKPDPYMFACYYVSWSTYADKEMIEWLVNHNVDINGYMSHYDGSALPHKITPLFQACINKKYDHMELLMNYGADLNTKCVYKQEEMTPLEFCVTNFEFEYSEYYRNYTAKNTDNDLNKLLGFDLSDIPETYYDANDLLLKDANNKLLNATNDQYLEKQKIISNLENELKIKYNEIKLLMKKKNELENKHENIEKWINAQERWTNFLAEWKRWNVFCFIEYLKRSKYVKKSYNEYYLNDSICKQKIDNYVKNHLMDEIKQNDDDKITYFVGTQLVNFTKTSIQQIGINDADDIESIHDSLQQLVNGYNVQINMVGEIDPNPNNQSKASTNDKSKIQAFFDNIQLSQYYNVMVSNDIVDISILKTLTEDDLKSLGISSFGHRRKIAMAIKSL